MADNQNVTWKAGDTGIITITIRKADGSVIDLAGATGRWWLAKSAATSEANAWLQKTVNPELSDSGDPASVYEMNVPIIEDDTNDLPSGTWYHEAEVVDSSGKISTVMTGKFTITRTLIR